MQITLRADHSYRAILIPPALEAEDVEAYAARRALPTIRLRAPNAVHAAACALWATRKRVFAVERVEVPQ